MPGKAVFEGLVVDENRKPVEVRYIGGEPFYVVDDEGFDRHIPSDYVDRQVFEAMKHDVLNNRDMIVEGMMQYLGKEDLFTKAAVETSISQMDASLDPLLQQGIPVETRQYLGMMGFYLMINVHGDLVEFHNPAGIIEDED